ncbi:MAG: hypothetical protein IJ733_02870 [Lachnospiraceae bacterium]|nr:hypothetical protein [Lachnospiraceae bacterium]
MDQMDCWKIFETTGKVEDYLRYADEKRINNACESFISAIESEGTDGRDNHGGRNGNFLDGYK